MTTFQEATAIFYYEDLTTPVEDDVKSFSIHHLCEEAKEEDLKIFGDALNSLVDDNLYHYTQVGQHVLFVSEA